jgi:hypothetical protein
MSVGKVKKFTPHMRVTQGPGGNQSFDIFKEATNAQPETEGVKTRKRTASMRNVSEESTKEETRPVARRPFAPGGKSTVNELLCDPKDEPRAAPAPKPGDTRAPRGAYFATSSDQSARAQCSRCLLRCSTSRRCA